VKLAEVMMFLQSPSNAGGATLFPEILKIVVAAAIGFLGAVLLEKYKRREKTVLSLTEYLEAVAMTLEGMAEGIEKGKLSYSHSHQFKHMVRNLRINLPQLVDEEMHVRLGELFKEYESIRESFARTHRSDKEEDYAFEKEWIAKARRAAGNLRARAQLLKIKAPHRFV
jgi:hypothetical protein